MKSEDIDHHVRAYIGVFVALLVLTGATVGAAYVDLGHSANIALALAIATLKASLVGLFFMHLKWEKRSIHGLLALAFVFFAAMIVLTLGGHGDTPVGTVIDRAVVEFIPH